MRGFYKEFHRLSQRESIIKDTVFYLPSNFMGQIISLLRGIAVRRLLGPLSYGWLNIFTLIERYAGYTDIGLINAMDRQVPLYRGAKNGRDEKATENNVFTFILASSIVIALAIFIYSFVSKNILFSDFLSTLRVFAIFLILYRLSTFFSIFLRTHREFKLMSQLNVLRGAVTLVFILFMAKKYHIKGVFGAEIAGLIIFIFMCMKNYSHPFSFAFDMKRIRQLISTGFPLLLISLAAVTIRNLDRFMVLTFLKEPLLLGYYSAGLLFSNTIAQIPDSISVILFPRLLEEFGESSDIPRLKKYVKDPTIIIAYLMAIIIAVVITVSPLFLKYVLPQYMPGLVPLRIVCAGAFFISLINMSGHFLIAINKQYQFLGIGGVSIILGIVLSFAFTKSGYGLAGIASAMALVYFIYNTVVIAYACRFFNNGNKDTFSFFFKIYFPFVYFTPLLFVLHRAGNLNGTFGMDLIVTLMRVAGIFLFSLPFVVYLEKRYFIFGGIRKIICRR